KLEAPLHFLPVSGQVESLLRFTQPVMRSKETTPTGLDPEGAAKSDTLGYVILGLSTERALREVWPATLRSVSTWTLIAFTVMIVVYLWWAARRLGRMSAFAHKIAAGELTADLDEPLSDDVGRLAESLRAMSQRTGRVVSQLQDASRSLSG